MLSKYYHLEQNNIAARKVDMNLFISALLANLREKYENVRIEQTFPGGTLGVFFEVYINGTRKFVKTHQYGYEYKENLLHEIEIMTLLYGDIIEIERIDIELKKIQITFMVMDYLFPGKFPVSIEKIQEYITYFQQKLSPEKISAKYHFNQMINAGKESLETLFALGFFNKEFYLRCSESIQRIIYNPKSKMNVVCHGDLSNVNIMYTSNGNPVIIDWEDAIYAFPEYDYLYWLTFFSQRQYYSSDLFYNADIEQLWGIDIMVLITIIKCKMSYQNGSYRNNQIPFCERINEIYKILV